MVSKALERSKKIPKVDCLFSKAVVTWSLNNVRTCEVECPCLKLNWRLDKRSELLKKRMKMFIYNFFKNF